MSWRGVFTAAIVTGAVTSIGAVACVTSANRCVDGYVYVEEYKACAPVAGASTDAAPAASDAASNSTSDAAAEGLGVACGADPDCAGKRASYCLKSPLAPTDPGVCSVPQCSAIDCGSEHACCDCGGAQVPELQAWPRGVCVPRSDSSTVQSFGCVCQ